MLVDHFFFRNVFQLKRCVKLYYCYSANIYKHSTLIGKPTNQSVSNTPHGEQSSVEVVGGGGAMIHLHLVRWIYYYGVAHMKSICWMDTGADSQTVSPYPRLKVNKTRVE